MKIRPKNTILFAQEGVKFSQNNLRGANWRQQVFNNYRQHLLDQLAKYGNDETYGNWLNEMQSRHSKIYNLAGGKDGNWENTAYQDDLVGQYQHDYKGDKRFGTIKLRNEDIYNFNQGISPNFNSRYVISNPPTRISGDNSTKNFNVDNLYSAITDDRRLLGREGDWDENSKEFKDWQSSLNRLGWKMTLNKEGDKYYYLERLNGSNNSDGVTMDLKSIDPLNTGEYNRQQALKRLEKNLLTSKIIGSGKQEPPIKTSWWDKLSKALSQYGPDILEAGRLAGNLRNNQLVYEAVKKGIVPNLRDSYHTYAQVKGDEGTKQAYYRRAVQGEAQAAKPFVSDADKTMAYRNEAKRIGDEGRAQGDLADNAEIRRTSDISDQHAWTNVARDNEVAGYNSAELNRVKGILANLDAQKLSADWTNWDTYLTGREYRWRDKLNEYRAATRQKNQILYQSAIDNDPELARINKEIQEHYKSNGNVIDDRIRELQKQLRQQQRNLELEWFDPVVLGKDHVELAKNGTTIKHKKKEDLLYKQVKDTVEHFRKMVKMSDDSRIKSSKKDNKRLILPPKTRKMQQGGIAPFTFFKPVAIGGETSTQVSSTGSSSSNSSSSKSGGSGKDEKLEFIKKLYQDIIGAGKGIPIDVSLVAGSINKSLEAASLLGGEMSTDQLASMYLSAAQKLNQLAYSQQILTNAEKVATQNGALDEYAVTSDGKYIVQDEKGNLKKAGLEQIKEGRLNPLTNNQLLFLRNHTPQMALQNGDQIMQEVVANSIGMSKINDEIIKMASNLGTDEIVKEGYTKQQAGEIKRGLELLQEAPAGDYKYTLTDKNQQRQAQLAQQFILRGLPKNYKAVLEINALENKMTPEQYIGAIIGSRTSNTQHLEFDAVTGKAAKDTNGSTEKGSVENSAGLAFVLGQGPRELLDFNTGTSNAIRVLGIKGVLQTHSKENLGQGSTLQDATKSQQGGYLQWNKATFGGSKLNSQSYSHIILNDSTIMGMDLPYTTDINGNEVPDFQMAKKMELADQEISKNNITDINQINQIYIKYGLDPKYTPDGKLNQPKYKRFAAIQVTLDENSLQNKDAILSDEVAIASEVERDLYNESMKKITGNNKFELDEGWPIFGGGTELYKGTIFIPYSEDIAFAALSSGQPFNQNLPNNVATIQEKQYAPKISQYVSPQVTLFQVKNN